MRHLCLFYVVSNSVLVNGRVSQFVMLSILTQRNRQNPFREIGLISALEKCP